MKNRILQRLQTLRQDLQGRPFDTLMVLIEENRRYLSGFTGQDGQFDESAGVLFINHERQLLATDSRYELQARTEAPEFEILCYKNGLSSSLCDILKDLKTRHLGFEAVRLSFHNHQRLQEQLDKKALRVTMVPTENLVEAFRAVKDPGEIEAIRRSLALSESVFDRLRETLRPGLTEKALAWILEKALREAGAEALAFPPIVASGPNAAMPHAVPTDRVVSEYEPLLFDWGARLDGYCSDISRTLVLGTPDETFPTVYQVVRDAQQMAIEAIKPGVSTCDVDKIARDHIASKGFVKYFGHGLGHGVGLATHERPHLSPLRPTTLQVGMVTTVEPGIYIPGWGGVRLENMVVVTESGAQVLNRSPI